MNKTVLSLQINILKQYSTTYLYKMRHLPNFERIAFTEVFFFLYKESWIHCFLERTRDIKLQKTAVLIAVI